LKREKQFLEPPLQLNHAEVEATDPFNSWEKNQISNEGLKDESHRTNIGQRTDARWPLENSKRRTDERLGGSQTGLGGRNIRCLDNPLTDKEPAQEKSSHG
jgi:hypothetical protein